MKFLMDYIKNMRGAWIPIELIILFVLITHWFFRTGNAYAMYILISIAMVGHFLTSIAIHSDLLDRLLKFLKKLRKKERKNEQ